MKKLIILLVYTALLYSCSDMPVLEPPVIETGDIQSRAAVIPDGGESESNPDLISDWENQSTVMLNSGGTVQLPWSNNGVATQMSADFCRSVSKSQGWTMLFHTFNKVGEDLHQNYMVFYNLFTGVVKVFYYYEGFQPSTNAHWIVYARPLSGTDPYKFMDVPDYFAKADNEPCLNSDYMLRLTNESAIATANNGIPNGFTHGWNGFDFQVSRYANDLTDCDFKIGAYVTNVIKSEFLGSLNLSVTGTMVSTTTPVTTSTTKYNGLASFFGSKATKVIDKLLSVGGSGSSGVKIGSSILGLASNIASGNISGILKSGFNLLFGRTTTTQTTYNTNTDVRLSAEGEIRLSGMSTWLTTNDIPTISFNLKEVLAAQNRPISVIKPPIIVPQSTSDGGIPIGGTIKDKLSGLGVWTLKSNPTLHWDVVKPMIIERIEDEGGDLLIYGSSSCPSVSNYDLEVEVNPYLKPWITNQKVSVRLMGYFESGALSQEYNCMDLSSQNLIYKDSYKSLYGLSTNATFTALYGTGSDYHPFDEETAPTVYVKWNLPTKYQIIALVTVEMNISYKGSSFTVTESRVYPTKSVVNTSAIESDFPRTLVLDNSNTWLTKRVFQ